jgi:hypothetical protein
MPDDREPMTLRAISAWPPALAFVCATVLGCNRPAPQEAAMPPPTASAPPPVVQAAEPREPKPYETPRPTGTRDATPLPDLREALPGEPGPKAGRQVLRCTDKGRITYVDLNATCAEGPGERVTVFPTQGVEASR